MDRGPKTGKKALTSKSLNAKSAQNFQRSEKQRHQLQDTNNNNNNNNINNNDAEMKWNEIIDAIDVSWG